MHRIFANINFRYSLSEKVKQIPCTLPLDKTWQARAESKAAAGTGTTVAENTAPRVIDPDKSFHCCVMGLKAT